METQFILANEFDFINATELNQIEVEVSTIGKMLSGLRKSMENQQLTIVN
jgi:hypothetical protein